MRRLVTFTLVVVLASAGVRAEVSTNGGSPMLRFAADEIANALKERVEDIRVFLSTGDSFPGGAAKKPPAIAEAFTITRPGNTIVVAGHDEVGAMYGGLEVAEQIALGDVQSVVEKESKPFLAFRQFKYNIPSVRDQEWFHSEDYDWREREKAAQQLVRNILRFAAGEKKEPRVVLLDASGHSTARMLDRIGMRYQWVDELPVAK